MPILILMAAAALLYRLQTVLYRKYWKKGLSVRIHFQKKPVLESETAVLTEVIENRKALPLAFLNVKFKISRSLVFQNMENTSTSDWNYKSDIFSVLWHQRISRELPFVCQKRGYYTIDMADVISSNLLMSDSLVAQLPQNTWFYVYPKEIDTSPLEIPFRKIMGTLTSRRFLYEDPFEFRGLREYTPRDPMNRINWKASARTGELMVNVHGSTTSQEIFLFLNLEDETVWKYDHLKEVAIRLTAALCSRFLKSSIPTRLVCNGRDCLSGTVSSLPAGNGIRQINAINEILSRVDLTKPPVPCLTQVQEVDAMQHPAQPLFIMISHCMKDDLQEAFRKLCTKGCAGLWIAPLYEEMDFHVEASRQMDVYRWEVGHYE